MKKINERREAFGKKAIERSEKFGLCLISTYDIYKALELSLQGKLQKSVFEDRIKKTVGVFKLSDII